MYMQFTLWLLDLITIYSSIDFHIYFILEFGAMQCCGGVQLLPKLAIILWHTGGSLGHSFNIKHSSIDWCPQKIHHSRTFLASVFCFTINLLCHAY